MEPWADGDMDSHQRTEKRGDGVKDGQGPRQTGNEWTKLRADEVTEGRSSDR